MIFGDCPLSEAEGAILAHSIPLPKGRLRKGRKLTQEDIAALAAAGQHSVVVARPEPGDLEEDIAAAQLAAALVPDPERAGLTVEAAFTGRVNIRATRPGIVELSKDAITALNAVDPMITLATVPQYQRAWPGMMVGTVKIISYAVPGKALAYAADAAAASLRVRPVELATAGLIVTASAGQLVEEDDKGIRAVAGRLEALGISLSETKIVPHDQGKIAEALADLQGDLALILTATATSDIRDVAPAAVLDAGGEITRFGMPVDPGNLLFLGQISARPVIGLPGCARSPALNGADWVLERVACGLPPSAGDIAAMAVGGLLKEIPTRPQPRAARKSK